MPEPRIRPLAHSAQDPATRYAATRALSEALVAPLSEADATLQSMDDASPAKWHLAHPTWFFETFLLRDRVPGYRLYREDWPFLFNSYYEAEGERLARSDRGMLSRPTLAEIRDWRTRVDAALAPLLGDPALADLVELGIAHEQQHQELLLTDIKHALAQNPLGPAMWQPPSIACGVSPGGGRDLRQPGASLGNFVNPRAGGDLGQPGALPERGSRRHGDSHQGSWLHHPGGIARVGHQADGFAFDNEGPAHRVLLEPFALSNRLVTNREWQAFIDEGGYRSAALWLSDGWAWVNRCGIAAPLYWRDDASGPQQFTHHGWRMRDPERPVTHISFYEADAFAAWAAGTWEGARLPTEFEWEAIARGQDRPGFDAAAGNQLDHPDLWAAPPLPTGTGELFGDCWQFTRSAYLPFPRFRPATGAVGEYNGKFMAGQWVLKGASCATPRGHSRASYRNFFYPQQRWQFTGLRLARDA